MNPFFLFLDVLSEAPNLFTSRLFRISRTRHGVEFWVANHSNAIPNHTKFNTAGDLEHLENSVQDSTRLVILQILHLLALLARALFGFGGQGKALLAGDIFDEFDFAKSQGAPVLVDRHLAYRLQIVLAEDRPACVAVKIAFVFFGTALGITQPQCGVAFESVIEFLHQCIDLRLCGDKSDGEGNGTSIRQTLFYVGEGRHRGEFLAK